MQGETINSILCKNSVDKISMDSKIKPFEYRKKPMIPQMSFVDDILDIKKCGNDTKIMNNYTTEEINQRKLQLSKDKCARMHIKSKKETQNKCELVSMDLWTEEKVKKGSKTFLQDTHKGEIPIDTVSKYSYLGDKILPDGSNKSTIEDRVNKGKGIVRDIVHVLEGTFFGNITLQLSNS